jgi:hypothetical protein
MRITFPQTFPAETESGNEWLSCPVPRDDFSIDEYLYLVWIMIIVLNRCRFMKRRRRTQMVSFNTGEGLQKLCLVCSRSTSNIKNGQHEAYYGVTDGNELAYLGCARMVPPPCDH